MKIAQTSNFRDQKLKKVFKATKARYHKANPWKNAKPSKLTQ
jgi:hypothetical protein